VIREFESVFLTVGNSYRNGRRERISSSETMIYQWTSLGLGLMVRKENVPRPYITAWANFATARSRGTIECLLALCLFFWFVCFSNRSDLCKLMLNSVVLLCFEWRVSSVRICFEYMPVCESVCSRKFVLCLCVDSCALCLTERKHELTW
jgi:hypothetical protein